MTFHVISHRAKYHINNRKQKNKIGNEYKRILKPIQREIFYAIQRKNDCRKSNY